MPKSIRYLYGNSVGAMMMNADEMYTLFFPFTSEHDGCRCSIGRWICTCQRGRARDVWEKVLIWMT